TQGPVRPPPQGTLGTDEGLKKGFRLGPRIHLRVEMDAVFEKGRKTVAKDVVVWALERARDASPRLAVVVSRKLGGAVRRNRLKRLIREVYRLHKAELKGGVDLVVYP